MSPPRATPRSGGLYPVYAFSISERIAELHAQRERLFLDPRLVVGEIRLLRPERDGDAVAQLEAGVAAHRVDAVDELADAALTDELVVERRVERDRERAVLGDREALDGGALAVEHLVGAELLAGDAHAASLELLVVAGLERRLHGRQPRAEPRPEHGEVGLELRANDGAVVEDDLLDVELLAELARVRGRAVRAADVCPAQRLPELDARVAASLVAELDDPPRVGDVVEELLVALSRVLPAGEEDRARLVVGAEDAPQVLAEERHHGRDDDERAHERGSQRRERGGIAVPEPPARAADVPVGQVVHEGLERRDDVRRPVPLVRVRRLGDELLGAREEPAVERLEVAGFGLRRDVRVVDEELRAVPERQQPALCLVRRAVAEVACSGSAPARSRASA